MPRAIWEGNISFGLINIPIGLYSLQSGDDLDLHYIDSRDESRVRYKRINEETGKEVPWKDLEKAYEYEEGHYVVLDKEHIKELHLPSTESIELQEFVELSQIPPSFFDKPYLLLPGKKGQKSYALFRKALLEEEKAAIGKVTLKTREHLGAVIPTEDALILNLLRFSQELKPLDKFDLPDLKKTEKSLTKKELQLARDLISSQAAEWNPKKFKDEYQDALNKYVETEIKSSKKKKPRRRRKVASKKPSNVIDIASLLEKSIQKNKKKSG